MHSIYLKLLELLRKKSYFYYYCYLCVCVHMCEQPSLNPEAGPGDVVLLNRWSVRNHQVQRGDIVSILWVKHHLYQHVLAGGLNLSVTSFLLLFLLFLFLLLASAPYLLSGWAPSPCISWTLMWWIHIHLPLSFSRVMLIHENPLDDAVSVDGIAVQADLPQVGQQCHSVGVQCTEGVIIRHQSLQAGQPVEGPGVDEGQPGVVGGL